MTYNELCESILTAKEEMFKCAIDANSVTLNGRKYGKLIENCPPNMKPTIFGMSIKTDYSMPDDYDFIMQRESPQPMTNADRIRMMTDEELAEWIERIRMLCANDACGRACPLIDICYSKAVEPTETLDWLKQEADI